MTRRKYSNLIIILAFACYLAYYKLILSNSTNSIVDFLNTGVMVVLAFISIVLLGFRKDKMTSVKKNILGMTISEVLIFFAVSYGLGIVTGFLKNSYALDVQSIFGNVFSPIIYVIAVEIMRYTVLNANKEDKIVIILTTILITLLELVMALRGQMMYDFETTFKITASIIIPVIIKNITLSYVSYNGGLKPVLVYRLIMDIYGYVMPFVPNLGEYINSMIGILLPSLIYMYSARMVDQREQEKDDEYTRKKFNITDIPVMIFIVILIMLISGQFTYAIIGVGSESMTPKIAKGDAVVFKKVKSGKDIEIGDIIVFKSGNKMIIHRLVDTKKDGDATYYITKGDANNSTDSINLTIDNVKGKVLFKVKYIAWPSLWLQDIIDKE